jgi:molybdopterin synthase catalytic subunit
MFQLSSEPLDQHPAILQQADVNAGARVVFEGRVRKINLDREVIRLEYEAAPDIAAAEFAALEQETRERFEILDVVCLHRIGMLERGDMAVWIGVLAPHRDAAFDACRYVINELKKRLPIWKKEYYTDGDSGWINAP